MPLESRNRARGRVNQNRASSAAPSTWRCATRVRLGIPSCWRSQAKASRVNSAWCVGGSSMDPELLGKLFGFLGTLVSLGSNLVGAINLKAPKDSGDTEQSSAAEPLRTFGRRAAAFCSSASQSFKGMTPQGRFGTSVGVSLLFFCSAFIGLGLNQFAAQFLPLINLVAKLIAGLPGIMALNEGQSSSFIVVAALLVLGALIFFWALPCSLRRCCSTTQPGQMCSMDPILSAYLSPSREWLRVSSWIFCLWLSCLESQRFFQSQILQRH